MCNHIVNNVLRAALAVALCLSTSCGTNDAITNAGNKVGEAGKDLGNGMKALGEGVAKLKELDPAGLNRLLTENADARKQVAELQALLANAQNLGVVSVDPSSEVWLEVSGYHGQIRIDAWVDTESNRFMQNIVPPPIDAVLDLPKNLLHNWVWKVRNDSGYITVLGNSRVWSYNAFGDAIHAQVDAEDVELVKQANEALSRYLRANHQPSANYARHKIDLRLVHPGPHRIYLRLTPEQTAADGKWRIEWRMFVKKTSGGAEDQFFVGAADSETSKWKLNVALAPFDAGGFEVAFPPGNK